MFAQAASAQSEWIESEWIVRPRIGLLRRLCVALDWFVCMCVFTVIGWHRADMECLSLDAKCKFGFRFVFLADSLRGTHSTLLVDSSWATDLRRLAQPSPLCANESSQPLRGSTTDENGTATSMTRDADYSISMALCRSHAYAHLIPNVEIETSFERFVALACDTKVSNLRPEVRSRREESLIRGTTCARSRRSNERRVCVSAAASSS